MGMYDNEFVPQLYEKIAKWAFISGGALIFIKIFGLTFNVFDLKNIFVVIGFVLLGVGVYFKFFIKRQ